MIQRYRRWAGPWEGLAIAKKVGFCERGLEGGGWRFLWARGFPFVRERWIILRTRWSRSTGGSDFQSNR
jgi:hypothetical protein